MEKELTAQDIWDDKKKLEKALRGTCPLDLTATNGQCRKEKCPIYEQCEDRCSKLIGSAEKAAKKTLDGILGLL